MDIYEISSKATSLRDGLLWAAIVHYICQELHSGNPLQKQWHDMKLRPADWRDTDITYFPSTCSYLPAELSAASSMEAPAVTTIVFFPVLLLASVSPIDEDWTWMRLLLGPPQQEASVIEPSYRLLPLPPSWVAVCLSLRTGLHSMFREVAWHTSEM